MKYKNIFAKHILFFYHLGTEEYLAPEVIGTDGHTSLVDWWTLGILIYELLFGVSPFKGPRRDFTFQNILHAPLKFPEKVNVSQDCKDLISGLLTKTPGERLGARGGGEEIKAQKWFAGLNWALTRNQEAPFIIKHKSTPVGSIPVMAHNPKYKQMKELAQ